MPPSFHQTLKTPPLRNFLSCCHALLLLMNLFSLPISQSKMAHWSQIRKQLLHSCNCDRRELEALFFMPILCSVTWSLKHIPVRPTYIGARMPPVFCRPHQLRNRVLVVRPFLTKPSLSCKTKPAVTSERRAEKLLLRQSHLQLTQVHATRRG